MKLFVLSLLFGVVVGDFLLLILHMNDMHSRWTGIDANTSPVENYREAEYGGDLRIKAKKLEIENDIKTFDPHRFILNLNGGDSFQGSPWFGCLGDPSKKALLTATFVKALQFDAFCPGNHELDLEIQPFIEFLNEAGYVISETKKYLRYSNACYANVAEFNADDESKWEPVDITDPKNWYKENEKVPIVVVANALIEHRAAGLHEKLRRSVVRIFEVPTENPKAPKYVAVRIIGYLTQETQKTLPDGTELTIVDEMEYVAKETRHLTALGIKIIIALGHSGFDIDKKIATIPNIDVVVGGHSNTFMYNSVGNFLDKQPESIRTSNDPPVLSYPVLIEKPKTKEFTPVVQAYMGTKYLGKLAVDFNEAGQLNLKGAATLEDALSIFTTCDPVQNPILLNDNLNFSSDNVSVSTINHHRKTSFALLLPKCCTNLNYWEDEFEKTRKMRDQVSQRNLLPNLQEYLEGGDICRRRGCNAGGVVVDGYVDEFTRQLANNPGLIKADTINSTAEFGLIGFTNSGAIRSSIGDIFTLPTKIKYVSSWDIMVVLAYNGDIGIIELSRDTLINAFKYSITEWKSHEATGRLLQVSSNVKVTYNFDEMIFHEVDSIPIQIPSVTLEIFSKSKNTYCDISGDEFANTKFYVVTTKHLAESEEGYDLLQGKLDASWKSVKEWDILKNFIADSSMIAASRKFDDRIGFLKDKNSTANIPKSLLV